MDLTDTTLDQLKTLYNVALTSARSETQKAQEYRTAIESREPQYRGRSTQELSSAVTGLYMARTFANTPHDLAEADNPFRRA
jgi:hypothetical protein